MQRVPIRMFETHNSYNKFVPIVYQIDMNPNDMETTSAIYNGYSTPSTICFGTSTLPNICEMFGASSHINDATRAWWENEASWDNWGKDYYVGDPASHEMGSVDVTVFNDGGQDNWSVEPSSNELCLAQTNVAAIECGATDFCVQSHGQCAMDLDCCQTKGIHMFCHPTWGYCVSTV